MEQKYALYKLEKVVGKKEYIPHQISSKGVSLKEAKRHLAMEYEDFPDGPLWYNPKIDDYVSYITDGNIMFVPNEGYDKNEEPVLIGVYGRYPIYYVDICPNPYQYYKLKVKKSPFLWSSIKLEGIK